MGSLFGGDDNAAAEAAEEAAKEAAAREAKRQADIKKGLAEIDKIFNGTITGYTPGTAYAPGTAQLNPGTFYNAQGQPFDWNNRSGSGFLKDGATTYPGLDLNAFNTWAGLPTGNQLWEPSTYQTPWPGGGGGGTSPPAWYTQGTDELGNTSYSLDANAYVRAMLDQLNQQGKLYSAGTPIYSGGFNDPFYQAKAQAYLDFYNPQLQEQYGDAKEDLTYGLANAGLLRSSAANKENADLFKQNQFQQIGLNQQAQAEATKLKQQVADEKSALISQLMVSADPDLAANQAAAAAKTLQSPNNAWDPLSEVFKAAIIGGGNYYQGYNQGQFASKYPIPNPLGGPGSGKTYG
jgi:hypothetical protein